MKNFYKFSFHIARKHTKTIYDHTKRKCFTSLHTFPIPYKRIAFNVNTGIYRWIGPENYVEYGGATNVGHVRNDTAENNRKRLLNVWRQHVGVKTLGKIRRQNWEFESIASWGWWLKQRGWSFISNLQHHKTSSRIFAILLTTTSLFSSNQGCRGKGTCGNGVPTPLNTFEAVLKWLFLWMRSHTFFVSTTSLHRI